MIFVDIFWFFLQENHSVGVSHSEENRSEQVGKCSGSCRLKARYAIKILIGGHKVWMRNMQDK